MTASPLVAVIGGGISGLAAAYRLRTLLGDGAGIAVFEGSERLGGELYTGELAGRPFDLGAEAFLWRRPELVELAVEIGLQPELVHPTPMMPALRAGGRLVPLPVRTLMGVPASAEAVRDVLSGAGAATVAAEPELAPVHLGGADVSVGALLRDRLGDEVVDRLVDPLLGGVYAGRADALSLRATVPALAAALDGGAGSVLEAVAGLLPPPSPGGAPGPPVFGSLSGGLGVLIDRLGALAGAEIALGSPVHGLRRTARGWRLEVGGQAPVDADGVVLAVPAPAAGRLLAGAAPDAAAHLAGVPAASVAVVALALPAGSSLPASSGVLIGSGERRADGAPFVAKAFTFSTRKWAHLGGDGGSVLVRGSVGRWGEEWDLARSDRDLVAAVRADLADLTGVETAPVAVAVRRWPQGLPQYGVGHLERVATIERAVAEQPGLAVAGAALHGVGLPACVATAFSAAVRIDAHLAGRASNRLDPRSNMRR